ncbi:phage tail tip lysozyme [Streptococcus canis]|uniref:Peptidase C51 domain-containing protein n=1 Tax=Streptococcus canis FSL Z3-227 TaxID=482234 RepID=A0AAV3FU64_STRCB|nr:phage tail tip lysozyme [Streptococcus canis]EIQ82681.1 hypothetical protein SCAZ3_09980 [Streptococcus canis FSL Z3-227]
MDRERRQTHTQTRSNTYRKQDSSPKSNLRQRVKKIGQLSRHKVVERKRLKEESVTSFQRFVKLKPRKAVKQAKREYKRSAREVRQAKRQYRQAKQSGDEKRLKITKDRLNELKEKRKVAKKVQSLAYRRNGGTLKRKLARKGYQSNRRLAESTVSEQETVGDIAQARQKWRRSKANYHQAKRIGRYAGKLGVESTKRTYGLTNRGYNFIRGRGFTRTAMSDRWEVKLAKRMRNFRHRLAASKAGKGIKGGWKVTKILTSPIRSILANPLSIKSYLLAFFLLMFLALFMGGSSPMSQSEEDLNKTWLHLSKLDREFSDETVDYWTNIDDVVHFMNYRYEDFSLGDKVEPEPSAHEGITYDLFLGVIWKGLNDDVDNLKTMSDLYGKKDSKVPDIVLSENELEEYQELLELAEETGRYLPYQELSNPFSTDDETTEPLLITKRYGYVSPSEIYKGTVLQVQNGHNLYAVMSGEVEVKGDTVIIKADGAEFTYAKVGQIRVTSGDVINEGELIGKVSSSEGQEVFYQKLSDGIIDTWEYVNPGFYFEHTAYNQTTSIIRPLDLSGDIGSRIQQAADLIKKYEPKATMQGISAMLGNFWTESNITAKRAEGDYLSPPVGASETSWDDPNWLSLGGMAIYGKYPNIIHRGLGLGQWTDTQDGAIRHTLLLNYAKEKGKKWYDLELQIDFIFNGDSPYYRQTARDILTNSANVETLTQRFLVEWEGNSGDKLAERQNNANQVYHHLKNPSPILGGGTLASTFNFPPAYLGKLKYGPPTQASMTHQIGSGYPVGQCTWYVYNRLIEVGTIKGHEGYGYLGNGQDWVGNLVARGWKFSTLPTVGAVVSTQGGFDGTTFQYGHVGFVEHVNPDGTFLVSELNINGVQDRIHYRVCSPASYYTFATRN